MPHFHKEQSLEESCDWHQRQVESGLSSNLRLRDSLTYTLCPLLPSTESICQYDFQFFKNFQV